MNDLLWRLGGAAALAFLVAAVARARHALSPSGALAAVAVGTVVVAGGGWWWGVLLVFFFVSSSALSRIGRRHASGDDVAARGSERDAVQVLANGSLPAAVAAASLTGGGAPAAALFGGFAGALAAVTADTWATEVGRHSATAPRLITTGHPVAPGTSGGVTPLGTFAAVLGATAIGALAAAGVAMGWVPGRPLPVLLGATAAGIAGSLVDSLLGATLQAAYRCPVCDLPTERTIHRCGSPTRLVRGRAVITNDVVNAAASLTGALVGIAIAAATA